MADIPINFFLYFFSRQRTFFQRLAEQTRTICSTVLKLYAKLCLLDISGNLFDVDQSGASSGLDPVVGALLFALDYDRVYGA